MPDMKEALDKSGALTPSRRLYLAATKALSAHDKNAARSADAFLDVVEVDPALLVEMIGKASIRGAALAYLRRRADEMGYKPTPRERRGHNPRDAQGGAAPAPRLPNGEEDKGHYISATQSAVAPSSPTQRDEDKGQLNIATHGRDAPSSRPNHDGGGHAHPGTQGISASPARGPSRQELAAMVKAKEANSTSVFSRRLSMDLMLGDATRRDLLNNLNKVQWMEHSIRRLVTEPDWPDDHTPLRKVVTEEQVKGILESSYRVLDSLGLTNHAA